MSRVLLCLVLTGCSAAQEPAPAQGAAPVVVAKALSFSFGWPVPAAARVTVEDDQRGRRSSYQYRIDLSDHEGELRLSFSQLKMITVGDKPVGVTEVVALGEQLAGVLPYLVIVDGKVADTGPLDAAIAAAAHMVAKGDDAKAARTRQTMATPGMIATMKAEAVRPWAATVSPWIGFVPGKRTEPGFALIELVNHGESKEAPGYYDVTHRRVKTEQAAREVIEAQMVALASGNREFVTTLMQQVSYAQIEVNYSAVIKPETLQPLRARVKETTSFKHDGGEQRNVRTTRYAFEWLPAGR